MQNVREFEKSSIRKNWQQDSGNDLSRGSLRRGVFPFILFLAAIFFVSSLKADWKNHLRPCEQDKVCTPIAGVDFIYMINLSERLDKLTASLRSLQKYNIVPYRFNAVDGWTLPSTVFSNLQPNPLSPVMNRGRIGCLISHLSVLYDAYKAGYSTIWVMEDDPDILENPHLLSAIIADLDQRDILWDILYTDVETKDSFGRRIYPVSIIPRPGVPAHDLYKRRYPVNDLCTEIGMRFGCYSMIIRRSGIEKILNFFEQNNLFLPIDNELPHVPGLVQITLTKDIVSHRREQMSNTQMSPAQHRTINNKLEKRGNFVKKNISYY
ncbi:MAG: glycosyltransferase family 25 protein [Rhabdochlamydiaceae bacterium]|jgi:GR25 family glycosyltransferase involved in LPS biosynthesis